MGRRKLCVGIIASALMFGTMIMPAAAGNAGDGSGYGTQPGYDRATSNTDCSGAGAFGAFGKDFNLGNETSGHYPADYSGPGANGYQTGLNNSTLCGNR